MDVLRILIPVSIGLGLLGLVAFFWTLRSNQYDDPAGDSRRILTDDYDDAPRATADPDASDSTNDPDDVADRDDGAGANGPRNTET